MLSCMQLGLNTVDIAATLRLYNEAFGFENAGAQGLWGQSIKLQGLAPDSRATMWWMIGSQDFVQFEFFQHTRPAQRLRPEGWRPCDHGWVRLGIGTPDYDRALKKLAEFDIAPIGQDKGSDGQRRCAYYDPFFGAVVEVREDREAVGPTLFYAAASVSDLEGARRHYGETLGFELGDLSELHQPGDEALWGLAGAKRDGFVVHSGEVKLEIVRYESPQGKPRRADHRASDQCFFNVALGSRSYEEVERAFERVRAAGDMHQINTLAEGELLVVYVNDPEREMELVVAPKALDDSIGFVSKGPFYG